MDEDPKLRDMLAKLDLTYAQGLAVTDIVEKWLHSYSPIANIDPLLVEFP